MILTDSDIKRRVNDGQLIIEGYTEGNVGSISYDLTIGSVIINGDNEVTQYDLNPGDVVFIKTAEKLRIPSDIMGRVTERNSKMRMGIVVSAPCYQPGHETYVYARVQNISDMVIKLAAGDGICQIMFEELKHRPEELYNKGFQREEHFKGLGNYRQEYETRMLRHVDRKQEEIDKMTDHIYANVMTIMGIIAAIFSLITINFEAFTQTAVSAPFILTMNLSLLLVVVVMMGLIHIIIRRKSDKGFTIAYCVIVAVLVVTTIISAFLIP